MKLIQLVHYKKISFNWVQNPTVLRDDIKYYDMVFKLLAWSNGSLMWQSIGYKSICCFLTENNNCFSRAPFVVDLVS